MDYYLRIGRLIAGKFNLISYKLAVDSSLVS